MLTTIRFDVDGPVVVATLTRPDKLNALSRAVVSELTELTERVIDDESVRVLVLAGEGRMFSAGADVEEFREAFVTGTVDPTVTEADSRDGTRLTDALADPRLVTIAAINGAAVGGAAALVTACDLRVMAEGSKIVVPELVMGFPLAWGGVPRLVAQLGPSVVRDLLLTSRPLHANEALRRGYACRVVPAEDLMTSSLELARLIAHHPEFGVTAALRRIGALESGGHVDDDAVTLAQATLDPAVMTATTAYLANI